MLPLRRLVPIALLPALLTGCAQSLFDDGAAGDDDRDRDGAPAPTPPDARTGEPDAGPVTRPDAGDPEPPDAGGRPDASVIPLECPDGCAGDAYAEFDVMQGGTTTLWRYVEVQSNGLYTNMTFVEVPDGVSVWQGTDLDPPTIARCDGATDEPPCFELEGLLALTSNGEGAHHPAVAWTATTYGSYILTGTWRVPSQAAGVEVTMRLTRNSDSDVLLSETLTLTAAPSPFSLEVNVKEGDVLALSARAVTGDSVTVAVDYFIVGPF